MTPLQNITADQLSKKAERFSEPYDTMFKKVAKSVFIEAVSWAIQVANGEVKVED